MNKEKDIYVGIVDKHAIIMSRKKAIKIIVQAIKEAEGFGPNTMAKTILNALLEG